MNQTTVSGNTAFAPDDVLIAIDIGGSKFITGLIDTAGNILYSERREWFGVSQDEVQQQIVDGLRDTRVKEPELFARARAGGVTIPGFADPVKGTWIDSDFLKIKNFPLCDILKAEFGIPFFADNDCNACALAEQYFGSARDSRNFLYLTVSTGIGGAVVLNEKLYYGAFNHAGEIGLCIMEKAGFASDSGIPGVLEAQASGRGLVQNFLACGGRPEIDGAVPDGRILARLADEGDAAALEALELEGRYLGRAIGDICNILAPQKVVLGGGISLLFPQYGAALRREFERVCPLEHTEILSTQLGYMGAFLGAGALALRGLRGLLPARAKDAKKDALVLSWEARDLHCDVLWDGESYCAANPQAGNIGGYIVADGIAENGQPLCSLFTPSVLKERVPALRGTAEESLPAALVMLAENGDQDAQCALEEFGRALGRAAAFACVILDPGEVVLKGTLGRALPQIWTEMKHALDAETYYHGNLPFTVYAS